MKVVLFCGGFGLRMRDYSQSIPKPMVPIGYRPVLWHVMKYYAHFGYKEFILCLGWKANVIKDYFLSYDECLSNDFVLSGGGSDIKLISRDIEDWKITFCDTGATASIGERLLSVREHIGGDDTFLANYTDGLSDVNLSEMVKFHQQQNSVATFLSVRPTQSFHTVHCDEAGRVSAIEAIGESNLWMNGGFFVFSNQIFDHLHAGEDLVDDGLRRLIPKGKCFSVKHRGFWGCMDTYKELQQLQDMYDRGKSPWMVWESTGESAVPRVNHPSSYSVSIHNSESAIQ